MTKTKSYIATLELDPRSGQWMADFEGLPVHTWGRSLAKVEEVGNVIGANAMSVACDVTSPDSVRAAFAQIATVHPRIEPMLCWLRIRWWSSTSDCP